MAVNSSLVEISSTYHQMLIHLHRQGHLDKRWLETLEAQVAVNLHCWHPSLRLSEHDFPKAWRIVIHEAAEDPVVHDPNDKAL